MVTQQTSLMRRRGLGPRGGQSPGGRGKNGVVGRVSFSPHVSTVFRLQRAWGTQRNQEGLSNSRYRPPASKHGPFPIPLPTPPSLGGAPGPRKPSDKHIRASHSSGNIVGNDLEKGEHCPGPAPEPSSPYVAL